MKKSLKILIPAIIVIVLILAYSISTLITALSINSRLKQSSQSKAIVITESIVLKLERLFSLGLTVNNITEFENELNEVVSEYEDISYALVYNTDKEIVSKDKYFENHNLLNTDFDLGKLQNEKLQVVELTANYKKYIDVIIPVYLDHDSSIHALVRTGFSTKGLKSVTFKTIIFSLSISVITLIFGVSILVASLNKLITSPLIKLSQAVKKVAGGNLDQDIQIETYGETAELITNFNQMVKDLRIARHEREEYNIKLQKQVETKTYQLQEKLEELRKMNTLMIGREIKMTQLKEKIAQLEKLNESLRMQQTDVNPEKN